MRTNKTFKVSARERKIVKLLRDFDLNFIIAKYL